jgi:hypothetical protein
MANITRYDPFGELATLNRPALGLSRCRLTEGPLCDAGVLFARRHRL